MEDFYENINCRRRNFDCKCIKSDANETELYVLLDYIYVYCGDYIYYP